MMLAQVSSRSRPVTRDRLYEINPWFVRKSCVARPLDIYHRAFLNCLYPLKIVFPILPSRHTSWLYLYHNSDGNEYYYEPEYH